MRRLQTKLKAAIPRPMRRRLQALPYAISVLFRMGGSTARECPACGHTGRFAAFGHPPRYDAECRRCGSLERHRLLRLAFDRVGLIRDGERVIHFAPEPIVARMMPPGTHYQSADIRPGRADLVLDMEAIDLPDNSVDVVLANHVLEHVDDQRALAELFRVIRPQGRLIVTIPLVEGWDTTYENPTVKEPSKRQLHFGQDDHVRVYGRDARSRMISAGFTLEEFVLSGEECVRYSLAPGERVFIARKSVAALNQ